MSLDKLDDIPPNCDVMQFAHRERGCRSVHQLRVHLQRERGDGEGGADRSSDLADSGGAELAAEALQREAFGVWGGGADHGTVHNIPRIYNALSAIL